MPSGYLFRINSQTFLSLFNANFIDWSDVFFILFVMLLWGLGAVIFVFGNCHNIMTGHWFSLKITTGSHYSMVVTIFRPEGLINLCSRKSLCFKKGEGS